MVKVILGDVAVLTVDGRRDIDWDEDEETRRGAGGNGEPFVLGIMGGCRAPCIHVIFERQAVDDQLHPSEDLFPRLGDSVV
jgi:hypothetical protein